MAWYTIAPSMKLLLLAAATAVVIRLLRPRQRLPPGPRGFPLIGNAFDIPTKHPWKVYQQWSQLYSSNVLSLQLPGVTLVILNSSQAIQDLLIQRSLIYSDRPKSTMLSDLMGLSWVFGFMDYGDRWTEYRKIFHREYISEGVEEARAHELLAARRLLKRLLHSTVNYEKEFRLAAGDVILSATYGISAGSKDDEFVQLAEGVVGAIAEVALNVWPVDLFPLLKFIPSWFPGAKFKRQTKQWKRLGDAMRISPFERTKLDAAKGVGTPSIASRILASLQDEDLKSSTQKEDIVRSVLGTAYIAGSDATVGGLCSFVLAMGLHPHVQKKAQAAVDTVLRGRLPDFTDYGSIPYVDALIREVLRWNPVAPLGIFHAVNQEDHYDGYVIPKGSIIVPNAWAMLHDETVYGQHTDRFMPERFLSSDGKLNPDVPDVEAAFGFGRRICPGRFMARDTMWITIASVLAAYDISDPVDLEGKPLQADGNLEYATSISSHPPPFNCTIRRRSVISEITILHGVDEN